MEITKHVLVLKYISLKLYGTDTNTMVFFITITGIGTLK